MALEYISFDFIYNRSTFTKFNTDKTPEEYLIPENKLLFNDLLFTSKNPLSEYRNDYAKYMDVLLQNSTVYSFLGWEEIESNSFYSLTRPHYAEKYLNKNIPLIIGLDAYYLRDEYKKNNGRIAGRHNNHAVNLLDINTKDMVCTIIDTYFNMKGNISFEALNRAMEAVSDSSGKYYAGFIKPIDDLKDKGFIWDLLKQNLENSLGDFSIINGKKYCKNVTAVKSLIRDFSDIVAELEYRYGIYTPQHISYPLIDFRWQRKSIGILFERINELLNITALDSIVPLLKKSGELWNTFDLLLDKMFSKNMNIKRHKDRLLTILKMILETENKIISSFDYLYTLLNKTC